MKQIIGTIIMLLILQQAFGQCVNCPGSTIIGPSASALGEQAYANGNSAFAAGFQARAEQNGSIALGLYAKSTYSSAMAFGVNVTAANSNSMVIGNGFSQGTPLINNMPNSLMIGFGSTKPTFFVGISLNSSSTGRIGIGNVTAPQAKLHIRADAGEPATLRLEATGTSGDNVFSRMLFTPNHSIQAADNQNFTFSTQSTKHFVFQNGNVGIGTNDPSSVLHIHQSEEPVLKLSNDQGNLIMAVVNTPWDYAPTSQAGDVVFKTHYSGDRHGMILNMNDAFNDGNSYIKFNDNLNHNTLTILNNGRVGIGTADPQAELEVKGDVLVVDGSVGLGTQQPKARLHIAQGDVFIEDIEYGIIMKSPDGNCWKGTLTNNGQLSFEPLEKCPGETNIATSSNLPNPAILMKPNPARSQVTINCEGVHRPDLHYQLLDTSGKIIQSGRLENNAAILYLVTLPNGVYLVQVMDRTQLIATEKLVVE